MARIRFFSERISFKPKNQRKLRTWLKSVAARHGREISDLNYVFCSDSHLVTLNREYLSHKSFTDIISFDLTEGDGISGEIYISIPRVRENAIKFGCSFEQEFIRVLVHGLLHFLRFKDKTPGEKGTVRREEEACISLWNSSFHVKPDRTY